jgi:hypothetical protein
VLPQARLRAEEALRNAVRWKVTAAQVVNPEFVERQPQILRLPRFAVPARPAAQDDSAFV